VREAAVVEWVDGNDAGIISGDGRQAGWARISDRDVDAAGGTGGGVSPEWIDDGGVRAAGAFGVLDVCGLGVEESPCAHAGPSDALAGAICAGEVARGNGA
jgi:hypothetical protein